MIFRTRFKTRASSLRSAYTLIEILVAVTIIGLLFSFGYVSFRDFSRRQSLAGAVKVLQGELRLAQQMALSGQKPDSGCSTLSGIRLRVITEDYGGSYVTEAVCVGIASGFELKTPVTLPGDVSISINQSDVLFNVLGKGNNVVGEQAVLILTQRGTGSVASVTVSSGGEIR